MVDLAHIVGHEAAKCLAASRAAYASVPPNLSAVDWTRALGLGLKVAEARQFEIRECIKAVVLFQAMMEALVTDAIENDGVPDGNSFAARWKGALGHFGITDDSHIEAYLVCYRSLRNKVVHPKGRRLQVDAGKLRFPFVHSSLREGWLAFEQLSAALGAPHDANSWEILCALHQIPTCLTASDYPDLDTLEVFLNKIHRDGLNSRGGPT